VIKWTKQEILHDKMNNEQTYHVWEGYLRKIPVERRKFPEQNGEGNLVSRLSLVNGTMKIDNPLSTLDPIQPISNIAH
jgi:hypothetical protein